MSGGLHTTWQTLARSRNKATLALLAAALESTSADVRAAAIRASIRRVDSQTHTQLISRFDRFSTADQKVLRESHRAMPHHAAPALKAAITCGDATLCANACGISVLCDDYDNFSALAKAISIPSCPNAPIILSTILRLSSRLNHELTEYASGHDRPSRDPAFARHQVLTALENLLSKSSTPHHREIVDAFLLLAPLDNATFLEILRDVHHRCHSRIVEELATSQDADLMSRLVQLLRDTGAPEAALKAIGSRTDRSFLTFLLYELKNPVPVRVLHNMSRLRAVAWLESDHHWLLELDGRAQAVAVDLAMASGIPRESVFELLKLLLRDGMAEGRRASCKALTRFDGPEADDLILQAVRDPDSAVQAAALRQLRPRRLPDALKFLVARLDSSAAEVRDAARSSLAEFNFLRYRAMFDILDQEALKTTGVLVHKVDTTAREKLIEELTSPSILSRVRGIEMAVAMSATDDVRDQLIELASHENVALRKEAVAALANCHGTRVLDVLAQVSRDSNHTVADTAKDSLRRIGSANNQLADHPDTAVGASLK